MCIRDRVQVGPTRNGRAIDRLFVNFHDSVEEAGMLPPFESDDHTKKSDHLVAYCSTKLARLAKFEWLTYSYRLYNPDSVEAFGRWVVSNDWRSVLLATSSNEKADIYQKEVLDAIEQFFPLITTRRKGTDLPWINAKVRKRVRQRKA